MLIEVSLSVIVYVQSLKEHGHDFRKKKMPILMFTKFCNAFFMCIHIFSAIR